MNPLQSKPLGSLPPLRYGVPRNESAVSISEWSSGDAELDDRGDESGEGAGGSGV